MITYHLQCSSEYVEKDIDMIMRQSSFASFLITINTTYKAYWKQGNPTIKLYGIFLHIQDNDWILGTSDNNKPIDFQTICHQLLRTNNPKEKLAHILKKENIPYIEANQPYLLSSVDILKTWGKEVWYTGIEERGVSLIQSQNKDIPLYYLDAFLPKRIKGFSFDKNLILIKQLVTHPHYFGDLYIELHQEKEEIYLVNHVDKDIYPSGIGSLLCGINPHMVKKLGGLENYKQHLGKLIYHYESIRNIVDKQLELLKKNYRDDYSCFQNLPSEIIEKEKTLYGEVCSMFLSIPIKVGDVITIPKLIPHSLRHGVNVIEFQTPSYERKIIAFNQKIVSQNSWDTDIAIKLMELKEDNNYLKQKKSSNFYYEDENYTEEEIGIFDSFVVTRTTIIPNYSHSVHAIDTYQLLYNLSDNLEIETNKSSFYLSMGDVLFIPAHTTLKTLFHSKNKGQFLLSYNI